jgi:alcohol dehydrogenase
MNYSELFYPPRMAVGPGSIESIIYFASEENLTNALIVTDARLANSPIMTAVTDVLKKAGVLYVIFDEVVPDPNVDIVDKVAALCNQHQCDHFIAVGGGSPIDVAKAASIVATNGGSIRNYLGIDRSVHRGAPLVAVNTTAGTGSEVTRAYVLTDDNGEKVVSSDCHCLVSLAISDPCMMLDLPRGLTAATGMDALSHAVEAYCSRNYNQYTDGLAIKAVSLISKSLLKVLEYPRDIIARTDMCWAAAMAGCAFSNSGLGLVHAIGHQIQNHYPIPHGQAVGLILPYVVDFHRKVIGNRIVDLGAALGLDDSATMGGRTVCRLYWMVMEANTPTLKDIDFKKSDISVISEGVLTESTLESNAVQPTLEEIKEILERAYQNDLATCAR